MISCPARPLRGAALLVAAAWLLTTPVQVQQPVGPQRLAADTIAELQAVGPMVDRMVRAGELESWSVRPDRVDPAATYETLRQRHRGVPVWGADVTLYRVRGVVESITGTVYSGIALDTVPGLSPTQAAARIEAAAGSRLAAPPALVVLPLPVGRYRLAHRATTLSAWTYFVDADDGGVLLRYDERRRQSSQCRAGEADCAVGVGTGFLGDRKKLSVTQSGSTFQARDTLRPADIITLDMQNDPVRALVLLGQTGLNPGFASSDIASSADNTWRDPAVIDAHVHMGWVYDYLFFRHDYDGIDDNDRRLFGMVNPSAVVVGENAFWAPPPFGPEAQGMMAFGESLGGQPFTALDIVGHEIAHAVSSHRALGDIVPVNFFGGVSTIPCPGAPFVCDQGQLLVAFNAAGAINEAFADVIGTSLEFFVGDATTADYAIGEELRGIGPIRALDDPGSVTCVQPVPSDPVNFVAAVPCPDHLARAALFPLVDTGAGLDFFPPQSDNGAEHDNSTIISHAFYLAVEGGTNRTSGQTVQGVGAANRGQVERAFFDALVDRIPTSPTFPQAAQAVVDASRARFGENSSTTTAIVEAFTAVGLPPQ